MTDATNTIQIVSMSGTLLGIGFFLTFCAAVGYAVYVLLARPGSRRAEFLTLGAASRRTSLLVAIAVSATLFAIICAAMFSGFTRVDVEGDLLRLHYVLPRRAATIRRDQLTLLEKKYAYKISWRLAITTANGATYESQPASAAAIEAARLRMAQIAVE